MVKLLHFADAHIDLARQGRHDPESGLPLRVLDFLKALDTIVDAAVREKVDLVIFAGDAYRDRTPQPTYQREWGRRIMRLSTAGIQTLLVLGNHDVSPAVGRAHALQEFETLRIPHVRVINKLGVLSPDELSGLPLQVIGIPWMNRSNLAAVLAGKQIDSSDLAAVIEENLTAEIKKLIDELDPELPTVLTGHVTVQGAKYGNERSVMLGRDFILPGSLVRDPRLDYVALGHIHKFQNLNPDGKPPVIYPGSIERVDFGEVDDRKTFVIAAIEKGKAELDIRDLTGRKFIDRSVNITERDNLQEQIMKILPSADEVKDAIFRLVINYPRDWEALIDAAAIRRETEGAFEFHLIRRPHIQARLRLPGDQSAASMSPMELLNLYWDTVPDHHSNVEILNQLANDIFRTVEYGSVPEETGLEKQA